MLLSKEESERRLNSTRNLLNVLPRDNSIVMPLHKSNGRSVGSKNTPQSLKIIAGVLSKTEPTREIVDALDVPASALHSRNPEVVSAVERTTTRIRDLALDKLMASLGIINDETLFNCTAKDASTVARNLAGVVEKLSPKDAATSGVTLVVYAPQQRKETHYETIDVKAGP